MFAWFLSLASLQCLVGFAHPDSLVYPHFDLEFRQFLLNRERTPDVTSLLPFGSLPTSYPMLLESNEIKSLIERLRQLSEKLSEKFTGDCIQDSLEFVFALTNLRDKLMENCNKKVDRNVSKCECKNSKTKAIQNDMWTLRVLDSYGKMPSGVMEGNTFWLGSYQECTKIDEKRGRARYKGKYCSLFIPVSLDAKGTIAVKGDDSCGNSTDVNTDKMTEGRMPPQTQFIRYGVCIPNSCDGTAIKSFLTFVANETHHGNLTREPKIICHEEQHIGKDPAAVIMICVCCIFAFVMVLGTLYDVCEFNPAVAALSLETNDASSRQNLYNSLGVFTKALLAFSVYSNAKKLLSVEKKAGQLECIHGIRFVSMTWVILGHTYFFAAPYLDNLGEFSKVLKEFTTQCLWNGTVAVDTFLVLSSFLLSYLWLKSTDKERGKNILSPFHWFKFYAHRYLRLTPAYMLILGMDVALFQYMADGPLWRQQGVENHRCANSWWTNLLYLNNFLHTDENCFGWSWYLAVDMQCHWLAPLLLILFYHAWPAALALSGAVIAMCCGLNGWLINKWNLPPNAIWTLNPTQFNPDPASGKLYFDYVYIKPYMRCGSYVVGMLFGFAFYKLKGRKLRLNKLLNLGIWLVAAASALLVLYGLYDITRGEVTTKAFNTFYSAVNRTVWATAIGWVIFACVTGNGGFVNKMLSYHLIFPLSRLTYCAYLVHPLVMYLIYESRERAVHFDSHYTMVYFFLANFAIAYSAAFVLSLAFESPIMTIERHLFDLLGGAPKKRPSRKRNEEKKSLTMESGDVPHSLIPEKEKDNLGFQKENEANLGKMNDIRL